MTRARLTGYLLAAANGALLITVRHVRNQRDRAIYALGETIAKHAGEQYLRDLMADWQHESDGVEFDDPEDAAHRFADFLANRTGLPIIAQQLDGDGVIVAIPDSEEDPDA